MSRQHNADDGAQPTPPRTSRAGRVAGALMCAVFAIAFGSVGIGALGAMGLMLHGAWAAASWQPVPAEVLESRLSTTTDSDGGTLRGLRARYRYVWKDHAYESSTIGLPGGFSRDNFDDWHQFWDARLRAASDGGPPVIAWVDPQHPERALLDRQLRWPQLAFLLPFGLVFSLVGLGAAYAGWRVATQTPTPEPPVAQRHRPQNSPAGLWVFAIVAGVMTLPAVFAATRQSAPWWVALIAAVFLVGSLALVRLAVRATRLAWVYRGTFASFQPVQPRAGHAFQASWTVPPQAAARWSSLPSVRLRVAQYRIDDSGSSSTERQVEAFTQPASPQQHPDGSVLLQARFELPGDAPGQGSRRAGEKVIWRLEWLDEQDRVLLKLPIPVQSDAPVSSAAQDRLSPTASRQPRDIPAEPVGDAMPPPPPGLQLQERPDDVMLGFSQRAWRRVAAVALVGFAAAAMHSPLMVETALLALGLHALSTRWTVTLRDDALLLNRSSWLWRRCSRLPAHRLAALYDQWLYSSGETSFHALWTRAADGSGDVRLTPGLAGQGAAQVAHLLRWAAAQRAGRFSPGGSRSAEAQGSRPDWGWLLCLLWVAGRLSLLP